MMAFKTPTSTAARGFWARNRQLGHLEEPGGQDSPDVRIADNTSTIAARVVASWLLDLTAAALVEDPALSQFAGRVSDSGEGRWTIKAAIDEGVPAPVLSAALYQRFTFAQ